MLKVYFLNIICLFQQATSTIYRIFVSNQAISPYLGTESSPFASLYSGFEHVTTNYSSATSVDEFHFLIVVVNSSQAFYLTDDEISNGQIFQSFQGEKKNI